jgi:hypothetical protein
MGSKEGPGEGGLGQIKHLPQSPFTGRFLDDDIQGWKKPGVFFLKNPAQWVFLFFLFFLVFFWVFLGFFAQMRGFLGFFQFHEYS